jgi:hypothetical protein
MSKSTKSSKSSDSRSKVVRKVIMDALESATTDSVISAAVEVTLYTKTGQHLKINTPSNKSSSTAKLVSGDKTIDAAPSGTFVMAGGQTLAIDKGRLVGGTDPRKALRHFALFALLPADREQSNK